MPISSKLKDRLFYGWVIVIVMVIINMAIMGVGNSFGVFFKSLAGEFTLSRATTSAISSVSWGLGGVFAIVGGWALDRYGPRIVMFLISLFVGLGLLLTSQTNSAWQLFITYGLLTSVGSGAIYVVTISTTLRWFEKRQGLAVGIASSGVGLGRVVIPPLATYLITKFDWRVAYFILGLITLLIAAPLSRLLKREPREIEALPNGVKSDSTDGYGPQPKTEENSFQTAGLSLVQAIRTRSFWLFIAVWLLWSYCLYLISTHIVPHATDIGFSAGEAATILSLFGGVALAGRLVMGSLSDKVGKKVTTIICSVLQAGAMVWLLWAQELWMLYLFVSVFSFAVGGMVPVVSALVGDTFGLRKIGIILGMLEAAWGIGAAVGPVLGGLIFDVSDSYYLSFLIGAVAMVIGTVLVALVRQEANQVLKGG